MTFSIYSVHCLLPLSGGEDVVRFDSAALQLVAGSGGRGLGGAGKKCPALLLCSCSVSLQMCDLLLGFDRDLQEAGLVWGRGPYIVQLETAFSVVLVSSLHCEKLMHKINVQC